MRKTIILLGVVAVAALLVASASAGNRGVTFTGIGLRPGSSGPFAASAIYSMNPDGTVFMASPIYFGNYCVEWTRENGWGTAVGNSGSVCRMSSQGTIMGSGYFAGDGTTRAATWGGAVDVWNALPEQPGFAPCGASYMSFYDMGGDGDYATGLTWEDCSTARAFRWDKATNTTVNLGSPNGDSGRGNAISDDGDTVVGWGQMLFGTWRGARWDDGSWSWVDGQGNIEPNVCAQSGKSCTYNGDDPVFGCPGEYVDDARCDTATCTANVCVGGPYAGNSCSYDWDCAGYCQGGPNDGDICTGDYYCPDTTVCIDNPAWSDAAFKGEARDISAGGDVVGRNFGFDYPDWNDAYIAKTDGSYVRIPTAPSFPDVWEPARISADGKTVVGLIGNPFFGSIPAFWNEGMGTQDLQLFLVQQGLDELFFWYLTRLTDVSADGTVMSGIGFDPDFYQEGFIVDLKKVWVCHAPPGQPEAARTLGVAFADVGNHMAHGDFLGTCEFLNSGGLSRVAELRQQLNERAQTIQNQSRYTGIGGPAGWDGSIQSDTARPEALTSKPGAAKARTIKAGAARKTRR